MKIRINIIVVVFVGLVCSLVVGRIAPDRTFELCAFAAESGPSKWVGNYAFSEFVPPDLIMQYKLTILKPSSNAEPNVLPAVLKLDGHMTAIRADCKAEASDSSCVIRYVGVHADKADPDLTSHGYLKPNDLLFTLTKQNGKLITTFSKLDPLEKKHEKPGRYFHKE